MNLPWQDGIGGRIGGQARSMLKRQRFLVLPIILAVLVSVERTFGADWPMWRYDANRSADTPRALPVDLHLAWVRQYPPLKVAWPDKPRMDFDAGYEPVVMGKTLFVASSRNDSVTALDTETGAERWRFCADGPVRFAPVAWRGKVYFVSDDGHLYCLQAATGTLRWRFRGGPTGRLLLGNKRLISAWPARGAPVLVDGKIYFAASIWPFMGTFIYAIDAEAGAVVWTNDGLGSTYIKQPHNSPAFAGVAPQGYMVAAGESLLVAGGRSVPACLDRRTGEQRYYHLGTYRKDGHFRVSAAGKHFVNSGMMFELATGKGLGAVDGDLVMSDGVVYASSGETIRALDLAHPRLIKVPARGRRKAQTIWKLPVLWEVNVGAGVKLHIKAGPRLYASVPGAVVTVDIPSGGGEPKVSWRSKIDGKPWTMIAADDKLFVVTREGAIACFGPNRVEPKRHVAKEAKAPANDRWTKTAADIIGRTGVTEGYCLAFGVGSGRLIEALARQTKLHIVGVDADAKKVHALRERLGRTGLYGTRIALLVGDPIAMQFPPYLASLIVSEDLEGAGLDAGRRFVERVFHCLRPYGGVACLPVPTEGQAAFAEAVAGAQLANAAVERTGGFARLTRAGPLPGSADWTHHYADPANTCVSKDALVKTPLGLLWFGGVSNAKILPRHGHGPSEQVVDGRLFIEGPDTIRALDVYTGRLLWEADLPGIGMAYDNTSHQPGANAIGSNYVSVNDGIYVAYGKVCLRLDPVTGKTMSEFKLPAGSGADETPTWGYIGVWEDLLIAGASPVIFSGKDKPGRRNNWDATSSERLVVMDRHSGKVHWSVDAAHSFRHNAICVGGGKVFCIDKHPLVAVGAMRRRGVAPQGEPTLLAFDVRKGTPLWSTTRDVFGTWLGYSAKHDILLQAGRASRDMLPNEPSNRMITYRGKDGSVVWSERVRYMGPCMIHGETIITEGPALSLLTGEVKTRENPLTGAEMPWRFTRNYGCNSAIASEHLILFRSAAAGYFDLSNLGGTGNFGGFKSGCTSNLIAAGGVLNAPDYTRTCTCSYQNQTSLALVHMPEVEVWTFNAFKAGDGPIKRVGINLGAPGDRVAADGTLWLEHPRAGSPSPYVPVTVVPEPPEWFCRHSSRIEGGDYPWVAASGAKGVTDVTIELAKDARAVRRYTVRLHFCEPDPIRRGQRMFSVALQGKRVLADLDIVKQADGPFRPVVKTFKGVRVKDELTIALTPSKSARIRAPVLCGIEVVAE